MPRKKPFLSADEGPVTIGVQRAEHRETRSPAQ